MSTAGSGHLLVPLRDGEELSASIMRQPGRAPAIVSFTPYRADDVAGASRAPHRQRFAAAGYHELLVDLRGTGSSGGESWEAWDTQEEGRDAADAVEWIARQPWCDGNVGVWGLSYGGITLFNLAPYKPQGLRAGVSVYGSPDIYADFLYPGGIPNAAGNAARDALIVAMDLVPPSLRDDGGRWRKVWEQHLDRLRADRIWSLRWLQHPDYDDHWSRRTADCAAIDTPMFLIGGWHDIFSEATVRAYEQLAGEKRLVVGPWPHVMPDYAEREPWDWTGEAIEWFDRWLRGRRPASPTAAPVRLFVEGRNTWVGLDGVDRAGDEQYVAYLGRDSQLVATPPLEPSVEGYDGDSTVGSEGELYDPMGLGIGHAPPQSHDLEKALVYVSEQLEDSLELRGAPRLTLYVEVESGTDLDLVAKLLDVSPDGTATLVTTGWLNGRHRIGRDVPQEIVQGGPLPYEVQLWSCARRINAGSRLALAVSTADFPRVFPPATAHRIRIHSSREAPSALLVPLGVGGDPVSIPRPEIARPAQPRPSREVTVESKGDVVTRYGTSFSAECAGAEINVAFSVEAEARPGEAAVVRSSATLGIDHPDGTRALAEVERSASRDEVRINGRVSLDGEEAFAGAWRGSVDDRLTQVVVRDWMPLRPTNGLNGPSQGGQ